MLLKHAHLPYRSLPCGIINPFIFIQPLDERVLDLRDQLTDVITRPRRQNVVGEEPGERHGGEVFDDGNAGEEAIDLT